MKMASIIHQYYDAFMTKYAATVLPSHIKAMSAICQCRTPDSNQLHVRCPNCNHAQLRPLSCGHRSCPQCQNHETSQWIDRQQDKLLPVAYFLVTFTLPHELRSLAWHHQRKVYSIFFACVASTMKDFGRNPKKLGAEMGMTMVLQTNNRKLDFHPHIHVVAPGGGINKRRRQWKKKKGKYLFNEKAMAAVFRARFLAALNENKLSIPTNVPKQWVVDCSHVGSGITALKYLARYLYRGVISEKNITSNQNGEVTFRYIESRSGKPEYRTLKGEDFLFLIVQHVLPKGFRRVRDYGFLHAKAKKLLIVVQLILRVHINSTEKRPRPSFQCPCCNSPMTIVKFRGALLNPG